MSENCQMIVFSNKAYNAIIRESFDKDPVETGGILLGHILDNGVWVVMEVLPPGINSIFRPAYFEYDEEFVNYLAQSVANQYKNPLDLLGLWHRHPGSMDFFSSTDDGTNATFASLNSSGAISGLVNIDPQFRLTMYHLDHCQSPVVTRPRYERIPIEVGDDIIPDEFFVLKYYDGDESCLNPYVDQRSSHRHFPGQGPSRSRIEYDPEYEPQNQSDYFSVKPRFLTAENSFENLLISATRFVIRNKKPFLVIILVLLCCVSMKPLISSMKETSKHAIEWVKDKTKKSPNIKYFEIRVNESIPLSSYRPNISGDEKYTWVSSGNSVEIKKDTAIGIQIGETDLSIVRGNESKVAVHIKVLPPEIHFNKKIIELSVGAKDTLSITPLSNRIEWICSDDTIASIDDNGVVSALSVGECSIKCKANGIESDSNCKVRVIESAK